MKMLLTSIFVLASLTASAVPIMESSADASSDKYCSQYNETALRAIYKKLLTINLESLNTRMSQEKEKTTLCRNIYANALVLGEENVLVGQAALKDHQKCIQSQMSMEEIKNLDFIFASAIEAKGFHTEDAYVEFHTRRNSAETCASSYQQTQKLKNLFNL